MPTNNLIRLHINKHSLFKQQVSPINSFEKTAGLIDHTKSKKKPWTDAEDLLVMKLVDQYGPHKWTFIAKNLPGRIGKQCRERWHNHLNPLIKKTPWADNEEWILFLYHKAIENKWAEIAKHIIGRTDNSIKNHWNSGMKRRIPEMVERLRKVKGDFEVQGSRLVEECGDEIERKALEIILLNRKYESVDSDSEEENESEQQQSNKENCQRNYLMLKPSSNNKVVGLIDKAIKKKKNGYFYKYLNHMQLVKKEQSNEKILQEQQQKQQQQEESWSLTPQKGEMQGYDIDDLRRYEFLQTPEAFNRMRRRSLVNRSSEKYLSNNSFGKANLQGHQNYIMPIKLFEDRQSSFHYI